MAKLPEKAKQVAQVHAQLIHCIVVACQNNALIPQLEPMLKASEENGWASLVNRIRQILKGERDTQMLIGLDEEDAAIILSILVGLQDPSALPQPINVQDSQYAIPGLATMIDKAAKGDLSALSALDNMRGQMLKTQGSIRQLGAILKPLVNGERDLKILTKNMDKKGEEFVEALLEELAKLNLH